METFQLNIEAIYRYMDDHFRDYYSLPEELDVTVYFPGREQFHSGLFRKVVEFPEPVFTDWNELTIPIFIYPEKNPAPGDRMEFDPYVNGFLFLSGIQELYLPDRDVHGRPRVESTLQYRFNIHRLPLVNIYFELLAFHLANRGINIKKRPLGQPGRNSTLEITHDIDRLRSGWYEMIGTGLRSDARNAFKLTAKGLMRKLSRKPDFYTEALFNLLAIEKPLGIKPLIFFLASQSRRDGDYNLHSPLLKSTLQKSFDAGAMVGLHAGYGTSSDEEMFSRQFSRLKALVPEANMNRQHFLHYNLLTTPAILDNQNIEFDHSLGFSTDYGFRNGICGPFRLYNFATGKPYRCIEIPLYFMDNSLIFNPKTFDQNLFLTNLNLINRFFNFRFSILFHNTVFYPLKYHHAAPFFSRLINFAKEMELLRT